MFNAIRKHKRNILKVSVVTMILSLLMLFNLNVALSADLPGCGPDGSNLCGMSGGRHVYKWIAAE